MSILPWLDALPAALGAFGHAHAVLLHGATGHGLLQAATLAVQYWLCEGTDTGHGRPCGRCQACSRVEASTHPDLQRLLPESLARQIGDDAATADGPDEGESRARRKPSRQIRIDEVRSAIDWLSTSSSRGRGKVVLIHPADAMNPQAAHALLKTLEEPPSGARLLLSCAQPDRLLPTVRSRCQLLKVPRPSAGQARQWLRDQGVADAEVLLAAASGRPLDAAAWAAAGVDGPVWRSLPEALLRQQTAAFEGWPLPRVLDVLGKLCHDALAVAAGASPRFFEAAAWPGADALPSLAQWSRQLASMARRIEHPWNERLLLEALLLQGARAWKGQSPGLGDAQLAGSDTLVP